MMLSACEPSWRPDHCMQRHGPGSGPGPLSVSIESQLTHSRLPYPHHPSDDSKSDAAAVPLPPPPFYEEELLGNCAAPTPPIPAVPQRPEPRCDIVKQGYLGQEKKKHQRYFVLRRGSHVGPSRLEWYKSLWNFTTLERCAGSVSLYHHHTQGVIYMQSCLRISKDCSARVGDTVMVHTRDQTLTLVAADLWEQCEWYWAIKRLVEEEPCRDSLDEDDDGYSTLSPEAGFIKVWFVMVKPISLGCSRSLAGEAELCLSSSAVTLVRSSVLASDILPLLGVRRFGHADGMFFMELGRTVPLGPGEIWMEAMDGDHAHVAQQIHDVFSDAVRSLRALPSFIRSPNRPDPISCHALPATRRWSDTCRKMVGLARPPAGPPVGPPSTSPARSELATSPPRCPHPDQHSSPLGDQQRSKPHKGNYMEMRSIQSALVEVRLGNGSSNPAGQHRGGAALDRSEADEDDDEDYMVMAPQSPITSATMAQDQSTLSAGQRASSAAISPVPYSSSSPLRRRPSRSAMDKGFELLSPGKTSESAPHKLPVGTARYSAQAQAWPQGGAVIDVTLPAGPGAGRRHPSWSKSMKNLSSCWPACLRGEKEK